LRWANTIIVTQVFNSDLKKGNSMKKLILASAITAAFVGQVAYAADAAPAAPASDHQVTFNVGVTSDYVFRGISQSRNRPALSGGFDYSHVPSGFYLGTWASTISWVNDNYPDGDLTMRANTPMEVDFYGGIKGEVIGALSFDVGAIHYYYPNHRLKLVAAPAGGPLAGATPGGLDANTTEVYGKVGYGPVYFKVNYAVGDAIFVSNKAGSFYLDLGADVPIAQGLLLNLHYGRWDFKNDPRFNDPASPASLYNYSDWKVGLTRDFGNGLTGAIAATGTNASTTMWNFNGTGYLGDNKGIVSLTKTF
jgi:uncharacterized protein (TIGR02001 family)